MVAQRNGFYLNALNISVERLDKHTQGRPDNEVYALRSEVVRSTFESDDSGDEVEDGAEPSTAMGSGAKTPVERSSLGLTGSLAEALRAEYDRVELD